MLLSGLAAESCPRGARLRGERLRVVGGKAFHQWSLADLHIPKNLIAVRSQKQQSALNSFVQDFQKHYKSETNCAKGYVVQSCKNAPKQKSSTPASGAPPSGAQGSQPQGGGQVQQVPQGGGTPQQVPQGGGAPQQVPQGGGTPQQVPQGGGSGGASGAPPGG